MDELSMMQGQLEILQKNQRETDKEIGQLTATVKALHPRFDDMRKEIRTLTTTVSENRGRDRVIAFLVGAMCIATIGFIVKEVLITAFTKG